MLPEITRSPPLSTQVKDLIQSAIVSGDLAPGAHLVETQLAARFRVSRGPLREALKTLAAEGLVEIRPGRGAFVIDPSPDEIEDMVVLRATLGGMAARYVAFRRDEAVFDRMARALDAMRAATAAGDEETFFDQHWVFYETMYRASNTVLYRAWSSLYGLFDIYVRRMGRPFLPLSRILLSYERFLDVFRSGDVEEAEAVVRSQSLIVGFEVLERPIPGKLHGYVTRRIDEDGSIVTFTPENGPETGRMADQPSRARPGSATA